MGGKCPVSVNKLARLPLNHCRLHLKPVITVQLSRCRKQLLIYVFSFIILELWVSVATRDVAGNVSHPAAQIGKTVTRQLTLQRTSSLHPFCSPLSAACTNATFSFSSCCSNSHFQQLSVSPCRRTFGRGGEKLQPIVEYRPERSYNRQAVGITRMFSVPHKVFAHIHVVNLNALVSNNLNGCRLQSRTSALAKNLKRNSWMWWWQETCYP